jgi:hypothetical protein
MPTYGAHELVLPEPISNLDVRNGQIWVGTVPVQPTPASQNDQIIFPTERLFRLPVGTFDGEPQRRAILLAENVLAGNSKPGPGDDQYTVPGTWVGKLFDEGQAEVGLPAPIVLDPHPDHGHDGYSSFPGFLYTGTRWSWEDKTGQSHEIDEEELRPILTAKGYTDLQFGPLKRSGGDIVVPFISRKGDSDLTFRVARLPPNGLDDLTLDARYVRPLEDRQIDIAAAVCLGETWWLPGIANGTDGRREIVVCYLQPGATLIEFARISALASLLLPGAPKHMRERYESREPRSLLLSNGLLLIGYNGDSLFVINPKAATYKIIFHPIERGLRISDLGKGKILLWKGNGRKCYIVQTS